MTDQSIFSVNVGKFLVTSLSDGQNTGNYQLLKGVEIDQIQNTLPKGSFEMGMAYFLIQTSSKKYLIDTGTGTKLFQNLQALNVKPNEIDAIFITHLHKDHIGGLLQDGQPTFENTPIFLSQVEHDYFTDDEITFPEGLQDHVNFARNVIEKYEFQLRLFDPNPISDSPINIIPDIQAIACFGHTPGHTNYLIHSKDQLLPFVGDMFHAYPIQMRYPKVAVTYDIDSNLAIEARTQLLKYIVDNEAQIAGSHIPFPSIGFVAAAKDGYIFKPSTQKVDQSTAEDSKAQNQESKCCLLI